MTKLCAAKLLQTRTDSSFIKEPSIYRGEASFTSSTVPTREHRGAKASKPCLNNYDIMDRETAVI